MVMLGQQHGNDGHEMLGHGLGESPHRPTWECPGPLH